MPNPIPNPIPDCSSIGHSRIISTDQCKSNTNDNLDLFPPDKINDTICTKPRTHCTYFNTNLINKPNKTTTTGNNTVTLFEHLNLTTDDKQTTINNFVTKKKNRSADITESQYANCTTENSNTLHCIITEGKGPTCYRSCLHTEHNYGKKLLYNFCSDNNKEFQTNIDKNHQCYSVKDFTPNSSNTE